MNIASVTMLRLLVTLSVALGTSDVAFAANRTQSLAGDWKFLLNGPVATAAGGALPVPDFADDIELPGTTDTRKKGPENKERLESSLTRLHRYIGPAWYQREFTIPSSWSGKSVTLFLERTKDTRVWIDGKDMGTSPILCTPQEYALGTLVPGVHTVTLLIDNSRKPVPGDNHQTSDNTQGNWNGVIGRIELQAVDPVSLADVQFYPIIAGKKIQVRLKIANTSGQAGKGNVTLAVKGPGGVAVEKTAPVSWTTEGGHAEVELALGDKALLWDEFSPNLYNLTTTLKTAAGEDRRTARFGLREFKATGSQFTINGRVTFLRGKHDACVFPLTGHPPMIKAGWLKYFKTCQDYGINFIRCHSWTPPEAAFEAADELGMYLQPELPFWGTFDEKIEAALLPEAERILKAYGNHPSFVMLTFGNELGGSREIMASMVKQLRSQDDRHLYAQGSNIYYWNPQLNPGDDFWTTMKTGKDAKFNVRGSFATVDGEGIIQSGPPNTLHNYSEAIKGIPVPVIGHEVGQFSVFPNFDEIKKYTGVFRTRNFELFKEKLDKAGMLNQADDFFRASGQLAAICYRQDVEIALGTPGFGGFDLLDLQDFPGQGTALVGILDAFMDSKGILKPAEWREFCAPQVLLARFDRYAWTTAQSFTAALQLANYGKGDVSAPVEWTLTDSKGRVLQRGKLPAVPATQGGLRDLGTLTIPLANVVAPAKLTLELRLRGTKIQNHYPIWVYPAEINTTPPAGVMLTQKLEPSALDELARGGRVVFSPAPGSAVQSVKGGFIGNFWGWWGGKNVPETTGFLCDPKHPALREFPTDYYTDWQWFNLLKGSQPAILQGLMKGNPIVQMIDNKMRNDKLGLIFEFRVGPGRLLVCMANLTGQASQPEARQLLRSLLDYAASDAFDPKESLTPAELSKLVGQ